MCHIFVRCRRQHMRSIKRQEQVLHPAWCRQWSSDCWTKLQSSVQLIGPICDCQRSLLLCQGHAKLRQRRKPSSPFSAERWLKLMIKIKWEQNFVKGTIPPRPPRRKLPPVSVRSGYGTVWPIFFFLFFFWLSSHPQHKTPHPVTLLRCVSHNGHNGWTQWTQWRGWGWLWWK